MAPPWPRDVLGSQKDTRQAAPTLAILDLADLKAFVSANQVTVQTRRRRVALSRMRIEPLPIAGAFRIVAEPVLDERGFFARCWDAELFAAHGMALPMGQGAVSWNALRGTLRGLHYQTGLHAETKLVRCSRGRAFDVIVDLREDSPCFGRWHTEVLSEGAPVSLYLPAGTAHGFQVLQDGTELTYSIAPAYCPEASGGVRWDDPVLGIPWPIEDAIISPKDCALPRFNERAR